MTTRLDRLLVILDTGSTPVTRKAAAKQLGEIQKLHPHELPNLLGRVFVFLRSKNWDTRIAASQAIQAIAENVPDWNPDGLKIKPEEFCVIGNVDLNGRLRFEEFDITTVLEKGEKLLGSAGDEYDFEEDPALAGMSRLETIAHQRQQLKKKLGFGIAGGSMDLGMDSLLDDEDLITEKQDNKKIMSQLSTESAADIVASQIAAISSDGQLSSREKNRAKRKAKLLAKQRSHENDNKSFDSNQGDVPAEKKRRTQSVLVEQPSEDKILIDNVSDGTMSMDELEEWPFESFCVELCSDLFNPAWEIRHGASSALREIIKLHGSSAGKTRDTPALKMLDVNTEWLEDVALKLLCVFALDRFGDYVSDEVVAPVHETCAQTLGTVLHHMPKGSVIKVLSVLIKLQSQEHLWQVRHGALLGLKYMLAVRKDMAKEVLPDILPWILNGLQDGDDDVRAVAAAALLPVAEELGTTFQEQVPNVLKILWDTLLELDDLTASTNSVMVLLSSLISIITKNSDFPVISDLNELVPRLWPFFKHNISSVRLSTLKTLNILIESSKCTDWLNSILSEQLHHLYQRIIFEGINEIRTIACEVWLKILRNVPIHFLQQTVHWYSANWFKLLIHPANIPIDRSLLSLGSTGNSSKTAIHNAGKMADEYYVANINIAMDQATQDAAVFTARITAARALGNLLTVFSLETTKQTLLYLLAAVETFVSSSSGLKIMSGSLVLHEWAKSCPNLQCPTDIVTLLQKVLSNQIVYDEVLYLHQRLQIDTQALVHLFAENDIDILRGAKVTSYSLDMSSAIAGQLYNESCTNLPGRVLPLVQTRQKQLVTTMTTMQNEYQKLHTRVLSSVAASLIALNKLTEKLNPIIRPIMDSVKKEEDPQLQRRTAVALAQLLTLCNGRAPCPNGKIVKNLCSFVCSDSSFTPSLVLDDMERLDVDSALLPNQSSEDLPRCGTTIGILTLQKKQKEALKNTIRRGKLTRNNSSNTGSRSNSGQSAKDIGLTTALMKDIENEEAQTALTVQRIGGTTALSTCAEMMGENLPSILPALWETFYLHIKQNVLFAERTQSEEELKQIICSLQVLEVSVPSLHSTLKNQMKDLLPHLLTCFDYPYTTIRHMASRCFGVLSKVVTTETMEMVLTKVVDILKQSENVMCRQGAIEAIVHIIDSLGMDILPYIVLMIVPVLGRMSDHSEDIRLMATNCFATLVQLMPLESSIPNPPSMSEFLVQKKASERHFLDQLLDGTKLDKFSIPIPIKCELRKYQQDGVNWLAFLKKYNLHGILCDDMGLGKTLQSICIMAADYHNMLKKFKISGKDEFKPKPSLVVCPPTLTGHWCYEVEKFCSKEHLSPLHYTGSPSERQRLQVLLKKHNLVVASYDIIRNDFEFFLSHHWNYCVLDEGHIIKNSKTKLSKVIKQLKSDHRVILSGTPIQNNVLELWSLFDFLMPGFLGSEREFTARFGRPILQSRDAKSSSKEQEAGALAMEALHKQTLPFLLRRMKEDVLQDLPPKIIQDYYCELSPLQIKLYEDFSRSKARREIDSSVTDEEKEPQPQASGHIFQALQYLRKVCNHPSLVLTKSHPEYESVSEKLKIEKSSMIDIQHSGKLVALKQLLLDCGIGCTENTSEDPLTSVVSQHRALIFCQLKSMLNILERDLLKAQMPSVTYSRLDGSVPAGSRHSIVQSFNNDPTIDVLLLTTHVGGLGLNLTGADTVIFVEHDWNPMKDLQAMDRAHRIGQKKVVNVYRLIARGTLEEKIMGLQKFKLNIANSIITQDNSSLQSMDTSQLLDLFTVGSGRDDKKKDAAAVSSASVSGTKSLKAIMEGMDELWDEKQYENEYDLDNFMGSLKT